MVSEKEKKLVYEYIDDSINKLKSEKKANIKKLNDFKQMLRDIEKDLKNLTINYELAFQLANTNLLASWLEIHTQQLYDLRIEILENYKVEFEIINRIWEHENITKEKLPSLEKTLDKLKITNERIEPFLDEIDKQIENYKNKADELRKSGIYG